MRTTAPGSISGLVAAGRCSRSSKPFETMARNSLSTLCRSERSTNGCCRDTEQGAERVPHVCSIAPAACRRACLPPVHEKLYQGIELGLTVCKLSRSLVYHLSWPL